MLKIKWKDSASLQTQTNVREDLLKHGFSERANEPWTFDQPEGTAINVEGLMEGLMIVSGGLTLRGTGDAYAWTVDMIPG